MIRGTPAIRIYIVPLEVSFDAILKCVKYCSLCILYDREKGKLELNEIHKQGQTILNLLKHIGRIIRAPPRLRT